MSTARVIDYPAKGVVRVVWGDLDAGENGIAADVSQWSEKTVQIGVATGTSVVTIQGSNDGTTWAPLNSKGSDADSPIPLSSLNAPGIYTILENPRFIRPSLFAGDGNNQVVTLWGVAGY
jgi:hypothetical protein